MQERNPKVEQRLDQLFDMIKFMYVVGAGAMGLCIIGFFYLLKTRDGFENKIENKVKEAVLILSEIKVALLGDFKEKGLITYVYDAREDIVIIKEKLGLK